MLKRILNIDWKSKVVNKCATLTPGGPNIDAVNNIIDNTNK